MEVDAAIIGELLSEETTASELERLSINIIGRAKRAPHWGVQSRFRVIYIYIYMLSVCLVCQINCVGGVTWTKHAHAQSLFFWRLNQ